MITDLPLGTEILVTAELYRDLRPRDPKVGQPHDVRYWRPINFYEPRYAILIGYRTLNEGWVEPGHRGGGSNDGGRGWRGWSRFTPPEDPSDVLTQSSLTVLTLEERS